MAVAVPVIASFAAGAAGISAIGAATTALGAMAGYATVAGAVLSGVGALTGKKDLMKIGTVLSLAGGVGTLASKAGGTAATAASATGAGEAVDEIAAEYAKQAGTGAAESLAPAGASSAAAAGSSVPLSAPALDPNAPGMQSLFEFATGSGQGAAAAAGVPGQPVAQNLVDNGFGRGFGGITTEQAAGRATTGLATPAMPASGGFTPNVPSVPPVLAQQAQGLTQADLTSYMQSSGNQGANAGPSLWDRATGWIKSNPDAAKLGGQAVFGAIGAYGQARQEDMLRDQENYQRSLWEQARARLNQPIRITYGGRQ